MAFLLILMVAFFCGSQEGAKAVRSEMSGHYKKKRAERNRGAEATGVSVAAVGSTLAHSLGLAGRGFLKGWRVGWPKGRTWVVDRMARRRAVTPPPEKTPEQAPVSPAPTDDTTPTGPGLAPVRNITSLKKATPAATNPTGVITMPITTTTGEATNHSSLLAALDAIATEAGANMDDASADLARSNQEVANVEALAGGLAQVGLDDESLGQINSLIEPFQQRANAAQVRLDASEALRAMADTARQSVIAKHGLMKEAHDATPQAAQKAYYQGD